MIPGAAPVRCNRHDGCTGAPTAAVKIDWAADGRVSGGRSDRRPQGHIHGAEHDAAFEPNHRNYQLISRKLRADWVDPF
jgi:hypothetical protein